MGYIQAMKVLDCGKNLTKIVLATRLLDVSSVLNILQQIPIVAIIHEYIDMTVEFHNIINSYNVQVLDSGDNLKLSRKKLVYKITGSLPLTDYLITSIATTILCYFYN